VKFVVVALLVALAVLHHDVWWWNDAEPLVFGFMPIGLAWHVGISIVAGFAWWLAVRFCWPAGLDDDKPTDEAGS